MALLTGESRSANSIHYMSPEQIEGDPLDHRSDIYSFSILAYEIFTGQKPFARDDLMAVMNMHAKTTIPDPQLIVPSLPDYISNLIFKACAKSPHLPYDTMQKIIDEFNRHAEKKDSR